MAKKATKSDNPAPPKKSEKGIPGKRYCVARRNTVQVGSAMRGPGTSLDDLNADAIRALVKSGAAVVAGSEEEPDSDEDRTQGGDTSVPDVTLLRFNPDELKGMSLGQLNIMARDAHVGPFKTERAAIAALSEHYQKSDSD